MARNDVILKIEPSDLQSQYVHSCKKEFLLRVKICRKEAKESRLFLRLVDVGLPKTSTAARDVLATEARESVLIFSSIISKSE
jgi:hypothetical protein